MELIAGKGNEIKEWLTRYGKQVSHYAIIDDTDDMLSEQQTHFVQTNPCIGITKADAEKVIEILTH